MNIISFILITSLCGGKIAHITLLHHHQTQCSWESTQRTHIGLLGLCTNVQALVKGWGA